VFRDQFVLEAYGLALLVTVLMLRHVARGWSNAPARIPLYIGTDGRPGFLVPRLWLWVAPGIVAVLVVVLGCAVALSPAPDDARPVPLALVFVLLAEVAGFVGWLSGLQVELGRGMTFRIAPIRLWRAVAAILVTVAATIYVAANP
jgi:hypothetical protein